MYIGDALSQVQVHGKPRTSRTSTTDLIASVHASIATALYILNIDPKLLDVESLTLNTKILMLQVWKCFVSMVLGSRLRFNSNPPSHTWMAICACMYWSSEVTSVCSGCYGCSGILGFPYNLLSWLLTNYMSFCFDFKIFGFTIELSTPPSNCGRSLTYI